MESQYAMNLFLEWKVSQLVKLPLVDAKNIAQHKNSIVTCGSNTQTAKIFSFVSATAIQHYEIPFEIECRYFIALPLFRV